MPVGDRSLALQTEQADYTTLANFLAILPRWLRAKVDDLVVRLHPLPSIEALFFDICARLTDDPNREAAVAEASLLLAVAYRQLGMDKKKQQPEAAASAQAGAHGDDDTVGSYRSSNAGSGRRSVDGGGSGAGSGSGGSLDSGPLAPQRELSSGGSRVRQVEELFALRPVLEGYQSSSSTSPSQKQQQQQGRGASGSRQRQRTATATASTTTASTSASTPSSSSGRVGWYFDLLSMDAFECDSLVARFSEMSRQETIALAMVTKALDAPGLPQLLW
jgi:hypothetical protein